MAGLTRRRLATIMLAAVLVVGLEVATIVVWVRWRDKVEFVSQQKLEVALLTFHPAQEYGSISTPLSVDELVEQTPIASPRVCVPLVTIPTARPQIAGAAIWSGGTSRPARFVIVVSVRFESAVEARRVLLGKRFALARCRTIDVTRPPMDRPSEHYRVVGHSPVSPLLWDRMRYTFVGENSSEFYVRQFANTVSWTVGAPGDSATARAQTLDGMVERLKEIKGL